MINKTINMLFNDDYKVSPALSQSDLATFERNIRQFFHEKIEGIARADFQSNPMDIGNIVDALLFARHELQNYYVVTDLKASGKVREVVDLAYASLQTKLKGNSEFPVDTGWLPDWPTNIAALKDTILACEHSGQTDLLDHFAVAIEQAITAVEYQNNWKLETRVNKIFELGKGYYEQLHEAGSRTMVGMEQWNKAHSKVEEINEDEHTKGFFDMLFNEKPGIIIHLQKELYGEFEGEQIKGRLDIYFEDVDNKIIMPWDGKTAACHTLFLKNYRSKKYGRQGALYSELCAQNYPGYKIDPFRFMVIPIETDEKPEEYEMDPGELYINTNGHTLDSGTRIKGWKELIREISWHKKTGKWEHRKDYYTHGKNMINSRAIIDSELLEVQEAVPLI